ncbi:MAG: hypothetical protein ACPG49_01760 [Chitinophagales bacterium]
MKSITEQDIWDLLDGDCTQSRSNYILEQLQLEEHQELLQIYETVQVLNQDLHSMKPAMPSANFNAAVMTKLQPVTEAQKIPLVDTNAFWKPMPMYFMLAFLLLTGLIYFLQGPISTSTDGEMGTLGRTIVEALGGLMQLAQNPIMFSSLALIYALGLLTILDSYLKKQFRHKRIANQR